MDCDLLVCDLDGTLRAGSADLDSALVAAFGRAAGRGLRISIATGRMPAAGGLLASPAELPRHFTG